jgi:hypothetical protein
MRGRDRGRGEGAAERIVTSSKIGLGGPGPLVIAIFTAALAGLFNERAREMRELERSNSEKLSVLEMIETVDPDKAAANLAFLSDSGLLSDKDQGGPHSSIFEAEITGPVPVLDAWRIEGAR